MFTTRIEMTKLSVTCQRFNTELGIEMPEVIRRQASPMTKELVDGAPPKNRAKAEQRARIQVKNAFYKKPAGPLFKGQQRGGTVANQGNTQWLYATPHALVGINPENDKTKTDLVEMGRLFKSSKPGAKWITTGQRGKQSVMMVKKPMVTKANFEKFTRLQLDKFGKLKASFAVGRDALKATWRLPRWIARHIESGRAKGSYINDLGNLLKPTFTIISNAKGCTSPESKANIARAIKGRAYKAAKDLQNQLRGIYRKAGFQKN